MSDTDIDISSLMGALKALITKNETELDAVIAKLEEVKRQLADFGDGSPAVGGQAAQTQCSSTRAERED